MTVIKVSIDDQNEDKIMTTHQMMTAMEQMVKVDVPLSDDHAHPALAAVATCLHHESHIPSKDLEISPS